jgi:hypothetical protein
MWQPQSPSIFCKGWTDNDELTPVFLLIHLSYHLIHFNKFWSGGCLHQIFWCMLVHFNPHFTWSKESNFIKFLKICLWYEKWVCYIKCGPSFIWRPFFTSTLSCRNGFLILRFPTKTLCAFLMQCNIPLSRICFKWIYSIDNNPSCPNPEYSVSSLLVFLL